MEVPYHHFCHMLLITQANLGTVVGTVWDYECQQAGIIGSHLSSCHHTMVIYTVWYWHRKRQTDQEKSTETQKPTCEFSLY